MAARQGAARAFPGPLLPGEEKRRRRRGRPLVGDGGRGQNRAAEEPSPQRERAAPALLLSLPPFLPFLFGTVFKLSTPAALKTPLRGSSESSVKAFHSSPSLQADSGGGGFPKTRGAAGGGHLSSEGEAEGMAEGRASRRLPAAQLPQEKRLEGRRISPGGRGSALHTSRGAFDYLWKYLAN